MHPNQRKRDTLDARALARLLAPLLYLSESTILRDISRKPQSLPAPVQVGGRKIWVVEDVVDFYPPPIGAAMRRAIAREFEGEIFAKPPVAVPDRGSLVHLTQDFISTKAASNNGRRQP